MMYDWSMESNYSTSLKGSLTDVVCARVGGANTTPFSFLNFFAAYFAERNLNGGDFEKRSIPKPARIPPQTPPAGGKSAEAGRIHSPRQIVSSCRVHSDFFFGIFVKKSSDFNQKVPFSLCVVESRTGIIAVLTALARNYL